MTSSLLARSTLLLADPIRGTTELHPTSWLHHPAVQRKPRWRGAHTFDRMHLLPPLESEIEAERNRTIDHDNWQRYAACQGMDLTLFFGGSAEQHPVIPRSVLRQARLVCEPCPVRADCLTWALEHDERGIWGGTSRRQRRSMLAAIASGDETIESVVKAECQPVTELSLQLA